MAAPDLPQPPTPPFPGAEAISTAIEEIGEGGRVIVLRGVDLELAVEWTVQRCRAAGLVVGQGRAARVPGGDRPLGVWARAVERLPGGRWTNVDGPTQPERLDQARRLVRDAVDCPTALILRSVEAADDLSGWLVEQLLDDVGVVPLLIVLVVAETAREPVERVVVGLDAHPRVDVIQLPRAAPEAIVDVLRGALGDTDDVNAHHPLVWLADGSATTAKMLARRWQDPAGRHALLDRVATRLRDLDPHGVLACLTAVQAPLVEGAPVSPRVAMLAGLAGVDARVVAEALAAAQAAGCVRQEGGHARFTHQLYAEAAASDALAVAAAHRSVITVLASMDAADGPVGAERARRGLLIGEVDPEAAERAGRWHLERGEPGEALEMLEHALLGPLSPKMRATLSRLAARALADMGEYDDAAHRLEAQIAVARRTGHADGLVRAVIDLLQVVPTVPDQRRVRLIDEALDAADSVAPELRDMMRIRAAVALRHHDQTRAAELCAMAKGSDDAALRARATAVQVVHGSQADVAGLTAKLTELETFDRTLYGVRRWSAFGRLLLAMIRGTRDEVERALDDVDDALVGGPVRELHAYAAVARLGLLRFDADVAGLQRLWDSPSWTLAPPGSHAAILLAVGHMLWTEALGPLPPMPPASRRVITLDAPGPRQAAEFTALGISAVRNPDLEGTLRKRLDQMAPDPESLPRDFRWGGSLVALAAFAGAAGDVERATRAADLLTPHIEEMAVIAPTSMAGPVGLHVAHARMAAGDLTAASASVDAALLCCERLRAPTWAAMTQHVRARIALVEQRHHDARDAVDRAESLLSGRPTPHLDATTERLRGQVEQAAKEVRLDVLSNRELEVLRLVAVGATNRAVAKELRISPKTVEYHLAGAFRSLGAANRTEAVELARRNQLL